MPGSTTARGYGHTHQQARRRALAAFRDGDPCAECGRPMWTGQPLDLCHDRATGTHKGLGHASCNRREGMLYYHRLVNRRRHSRNW